MIFRLGDSLVKNNRHKKKRRVVIDTNVISQGIGDHKQPQMDAVKIADSKNEHVYTKVIDDELKAIKKKKEIRHIPSFYDNIKKYRSKKRKDVIDTESPSHKQLKLRAPGKDKRILHAAIVTKSDTIITMDKEFEKKSDGIDGILIIKPDKYVSEKRKKKGRNRLIRKTQ